MLIDYRIWTFQKRVLAEYVCYVTFLSLVHTNTSMKTPAPTLLLNTAPSWILHNYSRDQLHGTQSFLKANRVAASPQIIRIWWNPKAHYLIHKSPPTVPVSARLIHSMFPNPASWKATLILSSHLHLGLPSGLSFHTKAIYASLISQYVLHAAANNIWWEV